MELEQWFQKRKHSEHGPVTFSAFIEASLGGATLEGEETWQARKKSNATHEDNMKQRNAMKMWKFAEAKGRNAGSSALDCSCRCVLTGEGQDQCTNEP